MIHICMGHRHSPISVHIHVYVCVTTILNCIKKVKHLSKNSPEIKGLNVHLSDPVDCLGILLWVRKQWLSPTHYLMCLPTVHLPVLFATAVCLLNQQMQFSLYPFYHFIYMNFLKWKANCCYTYKVSEKSTHTHTHRDEHAQTYSCAEVELSCRLCFYGNSR